MIVVISGCFTPQARSVLGLGWQAPSIPEVDSYILHLDDLDATSTREGVQAMLGEPPFVLQRRLNGEVDYVRWRYPIRNVSVVPLPSGANAQRRVVPAVVLRIELDAASRVTAWGFFHPVTDVRLEIRQSLSQADELFNKLCSPPRRISLDDALSSGTPKEEVLTRMRWFGERPFDEVLEQAQYRRLAKDPGEVLIYYADHPSPLYIPPMYVVVTFHSAPEHRTTWYFESLFDGCE